jgi:hypothetical protein
MTTSITTSSSYPPLLVALQQCYQEGMSPVNNYTVWANCLEEVYQQLGYQNTASDFVTAINQVWGPQVSGPTMLNAVTSLNNTGGQAFPASVVQPLINSLLATFLIRDDFNDNGSTQAGIFWSSPDIINYGTNTLTVATAAATLNQYINTNFNDGQNNNMYIRAKNIGSAPATGYVTLYAVPCSLLLTPQSWLPYEMSLPSSLQNLYDQSNALQIQPGEICINTTAFNYQGLPGGGHFCLIAVASGANGMPFPVPQSFPTNVDQANFIINNPNVAQRNMNYGNITGSTGIMNATLGNNNNVPTSFLISLTQNNEGSALPAGTTVTASITDPRCPYAPPVETWYNGVTLGGLTVPASINGTPGAALLNISFTIQLPPGASFAGTAPIMVSYYQVPQGQNSLMEAEVIRNYKLPGANQAARAAKGLNVFAANMESSEMVDDGTPLVLMGACQFTLV